MQNFYNLAYREEEREMIPFCRTEGIGLLPWSPLAGGFLSCNRLHNHAGGTPRSKGDEFGHRTYSRKTDFAILERVEEVAVRRGVTAAQIALAWLLHKPWITSPIIGASKSHHVNEAVTALSIKLSSEDISYLEALYEPRLVTW